MPRIRSLKPEHRQHRKVGALSHRQYRLWIGMICEADDDGRLVADPEQLRATIFGYHPDVSGTEVRQDLSRLAKIGLIRAYRCHGTDYACFPDWRDHQRIDKPKPSKLPAYTVRDRSKSHPGTVGEESTTDQGRILPDRKGSEGIKDLIGSEGKGGDGRETRSVLTHQNSNSNQPDQDRRLAAVKSAASQSLKAYAAGTFERVTGMTPEQFEKESKA